MKTKEINLKLGNIELRKYKGWNNPEIDGDISDKYEFVKWNTDTDGREYCYVLAFADKNSEGYDIRTVAARPWNLLDDNEQDFADYNKLVRMFFACVDEFNRFDDECEY